MTAQIEAAVGSYTFCRRLGLCTALAATDTRAAAVAAAAGTEDEAVNQRTAAVKTVASVAAEVG